MGETISISSLTFDHRIANIDKLIESKFELVMRRQDNAWHSIVS